MIKIFYKWKTNEKDDIQNNNVYDYTYNDYYTFYKFFRRASIPIESAIMLDYTVIYGNYGRLYVFKFGENQT